MILDEEDLADVQGAVEEVKEQVSSLAGFVQWAVVIWSVIGGLWLYKHW